jgi:hypothetical protein
VNSGPRRGSGIPHILEALPLLEMWEEEEDIGPMKKFALGPVSLLSCTDGLTPRESGVDKAYLNDLRLLQNNHKYLRC